MVVGFNRQVTKKIAIAVVSCGFCGIGNKNYGAKLLLATVVARQPLERTASSCLQQECLAIWFSRSLGHISFGAGGRSTQQQKSASAECAPTVCVYVVANDRKLLLIRLVALSIYYFFVVFVHSLSFFQNLYPSFSALWHLTQNAFFLFPS